MTRSCRQSASANEQQLRLSSEYDGPSHCPLFGGSCHRRLNQFCLRSQCSNDACTIFMIFCREIVCHILIERTHHLACHSCNRRSNLPPCEGRAAAVDAAAVRSARCAARSARVDSRTSVAPAERVLNLARHGDTRVENPHLSTAIAWWRARCDEARGTAVRHACAAWDGHATRVLNTSAKRCVPRAEALFAAPRLDCQRFRTSKLSNVRRFRFTTVSAMSIPTPKSVTSYTFNVISGPAGSARRCAWVEPAAARICLSETPDSVMRHHNRTTNRGLA